MINNIRTDYLKNYMTSLSGSGMQKITEQKTSGLMAIVASTTSLAYQRRNIDALIVVIDLKNSTYREFEEECSRFVAEIESIMQKLMQL
jgi:predicted component of type VI protein secretion system